MENATQIKADRTFGPHRLTYGTTGAHWFVGISTWHRKMHVKLYTERQPAFDRAKRLAALLTERVHVVKDLDGFGRIIRQGAGYFLDLNRDRRANHRVPKVKGPFATFADALARFEAERARTPEELEAERATEYRNRFIDRQWRQQHQEVA